LIQKALDRDGPDNITVVLGRFDGEGLKPPTAEDVIGFVGYDPGGDPVPEALASADSSSLARETVEERLPRDMLTSDDIPTKAEPDDPAETTAGRGKKKKPPSTRSLLALFMLALVAAATGGIFMLKCDHEPSSKVTLP